MCAVLIFVRFLNIELKSDENHHQYAGCPWLPPPKARCGYLWLPQCPTTPPSRYHVARVLIGARYLSLPCPSSCALYAELLSLANRCILKSHLARPYLWHVQCALWLPILLRVWQHAHEERRAPLPGS